MARKYPSIDVLKLIAGREAQFIDSAQFTDEDFARWFNATHFIDTEECLMTKATHSGVSIDRTVYSHPFGASEKDYKIDPIYIENPDNPEELILDIDAMIKADESKQGRTPPPEPPFEKEEPFTKIEIMFGDRLQNKLVPVIITEVTTHADDLTEITVWNFNLIGHSGDDRYSVWDVLSKDKRIGYEITNGDTGFDIVDNSDMSVHYVIPADQHIYEMNCGLFLTVEGESAHPTTFPIHNTDTIFVKNSRMGIFPNSNGEYSFEFASIFPSYVRFLEDTVEIISSNTLECDALWQIDGKSGKEHGKGYYTAMTFRFLENEN